METLTTNIMGNKNIHVVATDKPSRVYLIKSNNKLGITSNNPEFTENFGSGTQNQNIYITSDEEIKEGDWYALFMLDEKTKYETIKFDCIVKADLDKTNEYLVEPYSQYCKKIILTTDQDLIKDGVQAIDDEFLEWFVKNKSCEFVKIGKGYFKNDYEESFKIIIPQEELSKNEIDKFFVDMVCNPKEEPKQETLEEAGLKHCDILDEFPVLVNPLFSFKEGSKWQEKQTIEEVFEWLTTNNYLTDLKETMIKDFNKFKNK